MNNKTKKILKKILIIISSITGGIVLIIICSIIYLLLNFGNPARIGQRCMENLDLASIEDFINDANKLRTNDSLTQIGMRAISKKDFNKKYKKLDLRRIDVYKDRVNYVWMGGFDHTYLAIIFHANDSINVWARYNDYSTQLLYPKLGKLKLDLDNPKFVKRMKGNKKLIGQVPPTEKTAIFITNKRRANK